MGKDKKKRKRERKELRKAFQESIEEKGINQSDRLLDRVTTIPFISGEELHRNIALTFTYYKDSCCELANLDKNGAKKLTSEMKKLCKIKEGDIEKSRIIKDKLERNKKSRLIYAGLPEDLDIVEIDYTGGGAGRIFGGFIKRYFCVVAVKVKHI